MKTGVVSVGVRVEAHPSREDFGRTFLHVAPGLGALAVVQVAAVEREKMRLVLYACVLFVLLVGEALRGYFWHLKQKHPGSWMERTYDTVIPWLIRFGVIRREELGGVTTMVPYAVGLCIVFETLPLLAVLNGLLVLSAGDPAARWVGRRLPIYRFANSKSVGGVVAFIAAGFGMQYLTILLDPSFPIYTSFHYVTLTWCMVGSSCIGALAEVLAARKWDNFAIVVTSSLFMTPIFL